MKFVKSVGTWRFRIICRLGALGLLAGLFCVPAWAQNYSIDWYKVAGGGGTSTGTNGTSDYSLSGTRGQPDASAEAMTGGNYALMGGFWSLISVVQTPGAPLLSINFAGSHAIISWPSSAVGWTLQTNRDLATGIWGNYAGPLSNNRLTNSATTGSHFFRLKQ